MRLGQFFGRQRVSWADDFDRRDIEIAIPPVLVLSQRIPGVVGHLDVDRNDAPLATELGDERLRIVLRFVRHADVQKLMVADADPHLGRLVSHLRGEGLHADDMLAGALQRNLGPNLSIGNEPAHAAGRRAAVELAPGERLLRLIDRFRGDDRQRGDLLRGLQVLLQ